MYKTIFILTIITFLGGCAVTEEAYYVDREYGKAQNDAFDQQVAYKDYRYAEQTPTGMAGIHSEKIMETYQYSFDRDIDNAPDNNFSKGLYDQAED